MSKQIQQLAYSINEFCTLLGVSRSYFYKLPEEHRPRIIQRGGRYFIPRAEVARFLGEESAA